MNTLAPPDSEIYAQSEQIRKIRSKSYRRKSKDYVKDPLGEKPIVQKDIKQYFLP